MAMELLGKDMEIIKHVSQASWLGQSQSRLHLDFCIMKDNVGWQNLSQIKHIFFEWVKKLYLPIRGNRLCPVNFQHKLWIFRSALLFYSWSFHRNAPFGLNGPRDPVFRAPWPWGTWTKCILKPLRGSCGPPCLNSSSVGPTVWPPSENIHTFIIQMKTEQPCAASYKLTETPWLDQHQCRLSLY